MNNSKWCQTCKRCCWTNCDNPDCKEGTLGHTFKFSFNQIQQKVACSQKCAKIIDENGIWTKRRLIFRLLDSICECENQKHQLLTHIENIGLLNYECPFCKTVIINHELLQHGKSGAYKGWLHYNNSKFIGYKKWIICGSNDCRYSAYQKYEYS